MLADGLPNSSVLGHGSGGQVGKDQIFERFADKSALAKAVNIPVEHVSWDLPLWTDW